MCEKNTTLVDRALNGPNDKMPAPTATNEQELRAGKDKTPSFLARYTCASVLTAFLAVWCKATFVPEDEQPGVGVEMQSWHTPAFLTVGYLVSLPLLKLFTEKVLAPRYDLKALLTESMVLYNVAQVLLNGWTVWKIIDAVWFRGHPFIGDIHTISGASYAVWVHYCDKYLEFFDTYFMVLRGKTKQVSVLHVYHHFSIAWAWWAAVKLFPGGDSYFGALLNSWIHVMMYSYYALALLKVRCPWKRFLTQAQLVQFMTVVGYSILCMQLWPANEVQFKHKLCIYIQVWEMLSLFFLFSIFYRKSYSQKQKGGVENGAAKEETKADTVDEDDDQCQAAVARATSTATEMIGTAAKDANKVVSSAKRTLIESAAPVQKATGDSMSRPSWSIVS